MYVSTSLTYQLDKIVKLFEVALRSYLSDKISTMFNTKDELKSYLEVFNSLLITYSIENEQCVMLFVWWGTGAVICCNCIL